MLRKTAVPAGFALALAAVALFAIGSTAATAAGFALVGVAAVVAVSLAFWAVGRSEDRERAAAEAEAAARRAEAPAHDEPRAHDEPPSPARDRRRPLPPRRGHQP